jgi:DinB family protein
MSRRLTFEEAAADHREAIETVVRAVRSVDTQVWEVACAPGKWSPAEIAEHLALAYGPPLAELEGGAGYALRVKGWKQRLVRWRYLPVILERGAFPPGVKAPREARPSGHAGSPEAAIARLTESASRFERRLAEAQANGPVRLTHAYFGKLTAPQILKLLAVHARHHRAQLPDAARIRPNREV